MSESQPDVITTEETPTLAELKAEVSAIQQRLDIFFHRLTALELKST